jgi:Uma2 family endonuclease
MALPLMEEIPYYTYADYEEWDESLHCEIIDGKSVMGATPSYMHQRISIQISTLLNIFLKGKPCKVIPAPFTVRLFPKRDKSDDTVVEPDILVVCDQSKIHHESCQGAPDLVVEILSPSTARSDRVVKLRKYLKAGVREYWIVDPDHKIVEVCLLEDDRYSYSTYDETDILPVTVLPGCELTLSEVFAE